MRRFANPVLPGFHPDPSVCRVGDDFYLVCSSFEFFPGLPLFHSRDLVHWRPIGHAVDRPTQLVYDAVRPSGGLYAPTLRYNKGIFYLVNTFVSGTGPSGNFLLTASNIEGPWSDPIWLDVPGIDPSIFFDDDGKAWMCGNRYAEPSTYEGHCEIWLQEFDLDSLSLTGPRKGIWQGALKNAVWAEGPHIYKRNGWYYLVASEAGTAHNHALSVARSESISGNYQGYAANPILTHRHLGLNYPLVGTGHADFVELADGSWWMVLLAMRPYGGYHYNLGRETFLCPLSWEQDWPLINPGKGLVELEGNAPLLLEQEWPPEPSCDSFDKARLSTCWNFLRVPDQHSYNLSERPGYLRLYCIPQAFGARVSPAWIGRRQQHKSFQVYCALEFFPDKNDNNSCAGLVLLQNDGWNIRYILQIKQNIIQLELIVRQNGIDTIIHTEEVENTKQILMVEAQEQEYRFASRQEHIAMSGTWTSIDGRMLSSTKAGGFTGAYIGMYASGNGKTVSSYADFDYFSYTSS